MASAMRDCLEMKAVPPDHARVGATPRRVGDGKSCEADPSIRPACRAEAVSRPCSAPHGLSVGGRAAHDLGYTETAAFGHILLTTWGTVIVWLMSG